MLDIILCQLKDRRTCNTFLQFFQEECLYTFLSAAEVYGFSREKGLQQFSLSYGSIESDKCNRWREHNVEAGSCSDLHPIMGSHVKIL